MTDYWRIDRRIVPSGQYALGPGNLLAAVSPTPRKMNPWTMVIIGGAVEAGWASASIDGVVIAPTGAGDVFAHAITDGEQHSFDFAITDVGREIARKAGAPADNQSLYPKLGHADHFNILGNDPVEIGAHKLRVVQANFDLVDRPPNLEAYVRGQMAVVSAMSGRPVNKANTTDSEHKQGRFLLELRDGCRWKPAAADIIDLGKSFTTHRVDKSLACLRADPAATAESCLSAD